jgi:hypothetical protein
MGRKGEPVLSVHNRCHLPPTKKSARAHAPNRMKRQRRTLVSIAARFCAPSGHPRTEIVDNHFTVIKDVVSGQARPQQCCLTSIPCVTTRARSSGSIYLRLGLAKHKTIIVWVDKTHRNIPEARINQHVDEVTVKDVAQCSQW